MKIIILDRDGVINQEFPNQYVVKEEEFIPIPKSLEAIAALKQTGYIVVIATNQSIIAKKIISLQELEKIHKKLQKLLAIYNVQVDKIFFCPHQKSDNCECRKPNPGMLLQIAEEYQVDLKLTTVYFVGDSLSDLIAAKSVGAIPVLVKTGKGCHTMHDDCIRDFQNLLIFEDLYDFTNYLLNHDSIRSL